MSQEANSKLLEVAKKLTDKGFKASVEDIKHRGIPMRGRLVVRGDRFDTPLFCDLRGAWSSNEDETTDLNILLDNLRIAKMLRRLGWFAQVEDEDEYLVVSVYDRSGRTLIFQDVLDGYAYTDAEVLVVVGDVVSDLVDGGHTGECVGLEDTATGDLFIPTPGEVSDPDPTRTVAEAAEEDLI